MGSRQYRDSRGSTGTTNPVRPRKKGDAIAPTRQRKKKHFPRNEFTCMVTQRSWPRWCLLEETITLGTNFFFSCWAPHHCQPVNKIGGRQWHCMRSLFMPWWSSPFKPCAIRLPNSEKMGRGAVRRIKLTSSAIVSAPEFNLNVNLCGWNVNRMFSIKIYPAG